MWPVTICETRPSLIWTIYLKSVGGSINVWEASKPFWTNIDTVDEETSGQLRWIISEEFLNVFAI